MDKAVHSLHYYGVAEVYQYRALLSSYTMPPRDNSILWEPLDPTSPIHMDWSMAGIATCLHVSQRGGWWTSTLWKRISNDPIWQSSHSALSAWEYGAQYHRVKVYKYMTQEKGSHIITCLTYFYIWLQGYGNTECYPSERGMMKVWQSIMNNDIRPPQTHFVSMCMYSEIFMEKRWRSVISRSVCDYFFEAQTKATSPSDTPPVIPTPQYYLIIIYRNNLYFVARSPGEWR